MSKLCDNCGQQNLNSDTACWQCGASLGEAEPDQVVTPHWAEELLASSRPLLIYGSFTAVLLLAITFFLYRLGQYPQPPFNLTQLQGGWQPVAETSSDYTLLTPPEWSWTPFFTDSRFTTPPLIDEWRPWSTIASDIELLLIGQPDGGGKNFVAIGRSLQLSRFSHAQLSQLMNESTELQLFNEAVVERYDGNYQTFFTSPKSAPGQRCVYYALPGIDQENPAAYLALACGQSGEQEMLIRILDSFHALP